MSDDIVHEELVENEPVPAQVVHATGQGECTSEVSSSVGQLGVSFQSPPVEKLPLSMIPEGWQLIRDGMSFGEESGPLVF